jgi:hypothetical protein
MPTFHQQGDVRFVAYITGPTHNLLGLEFASCDVGQPVLEARQSTAACSHGRIDEAELVKAVFLGLADAGASGSAPLWVRRVVYVVDDSPRYDIYRHCAKLLASRQLHDGIPPSGSGQ